MRTRKRSNPSMFGFALPIVVLVVGLLLMLSAAWITHVITCLLEGAWGFLIAGAIMFPIAIVHGIGIWFGIF